jgi:carbon-monoxide dehydrogenase medium subunit
MKAAAFDYVRARDVADACALLAENGDAKLLAGGQSLGPMLNLRLAQPALLIDLTRIPDLARVEETADAVTLGATVTHAAIEDRRIADPTHGFLARVAAGIAYRAVRTRGTIGGSLVHADPAADWVSSLVALGADVSITGADSARRRVRLADFMRGAMDVALAHDDVLDGVTIPRLSRSARCGYHKVCRKTGEYAEAIGVAVIDSDRGLHRLVIGAGGGRPIVIEGEEASRLVADRHDATALRDRLAGAGVKGDAYLTGIRAAALRRAIDEAFRA